MRALGGFLSACLTGAIAAGALALFAVLHPSSPLPAHWNPTGPLDVAAPVTPVTRWKFGRSQTGSACHAALATSGARFDVLPDREVSEVCHIRDRVRLTSLGEVGIAPLETRCTIALRLAFWARHGLTPAAADHLGAGVARLHHLNSYNCRQIRTPRGPANRMSTHATADAVDITGVTLSDGRRIELRTHWGTGPEGRFLKAARDTSCDWFVTTLGPDFNALHAGHFHLQSRGWGLCR